MKADSTSLVSLFLKDVQYRVPLYQRPYVWTQDKQWAPLIEEILDLATAECSAPVSLPRRPHFMGAVVFEAIDFAANTFEARSVIDGQQRLTTLQLLLGATAHTFRERDLAAPARVIAELIHNKADLVTHPDESFKVWPTNANRHAFTTVMHADGPDLDAPDDPGNLIQEAFRFFHRSLAEWLDDGEPDKEELQRRAVTLRDVLRQRVRLVVIDLEDEDDPQVIFETLNDRGTPLLKIDLVKNLVFQRAERAGADPPELQALYDDRWAEFDTEQWRRSDTIGRERVVRAEVYLMHWLTMQLAAEVKVPHLFSAFRQLLDAEEAPGIVECVNEFARDAQVFAAFGSWPPNSVEATFFARMRTLDTTTHFPLALLLFKQSADVLSSERRSRALRVLESWFVRRMICRLTAKNYNRFLVEVLAAVKQDISHADEVIFSLLRRADAATNEWPGDDEVHQILVSNPLYKRQVTIARTAMLLQAAEQQMRSRFSESVSLPPGLTVEHVLPRTWPDHWPIPENAEMRRDRELHIDRLGNLTLVTGRLNSSASNGPWEAKRNGLNDHSALFINRPLVDHHGMWDEGSIDARSADLAGHILRAWAGPNEAEWPAVE